MLVATLRPRKAMSLVQLCLVLLLALGLCSPPTPAQAIYQCTPATQARLLAPWYNFKSDPIFENNNPDHGVEQSKMQYDACKFGLKSSNLIEIVEVTIYDNNVKSVLQSSYNKKPYVGIVCNGYRQLERQVLPYASGTSWCAQNGVVDIAPLFNSDVWRQWLPPLIWASAAPAVETALLLKYATVVLRISRLVIFDATDSDFPNAEKVLTKAGSGAGTVLTKFTQTMNPTALVAMKPQMALIYPAHWYRDGFSRWPTLKLLTSEPGLVDLIVSPMMDSYGITEREMAKGLQSKIAPGYNQRIIMCSTNHLARDLQYTEIQAFQSDWRSFSGGVQLDKDDPNDQMFAVAGWVQGKFASILMALPEAHCTTGHALANYLFYGGTAFAPSDYSKPIKMGGGNAFDLYDFHLGGYAVSSPTGCPDTDQCRCNQGGRAVWLYEVGIDLTQKKLWKIWHLNESFSYSDAECYYDPATFPSFVTVTMLYPKEKTRSAESGLGVTQIPLDFLNRIADQMKITIGTTDNREVSVGHMDVDETTDWTQLQADLPSQVYIGSAVPGMKLTNKLALNMIPTNGAKPAADPFDPNALSVTPTLQQSIYDCYGMLLTNAPGVGPDEVYRASFVGEVKFFYANVDEAKLDALAKAAAKEWNQKEPGAPLPLTDLSAAFSKNCVNFVVGGMGQEEEIMTLLNENPDAFVFLPWDDYIQMYPALQAACAKVGESARNRLLTTTNLPQGGDMSERAESKSLLLKEFHKVTTSMEENQAPAYLTFFAAMQLLRWAILSTDLTKVTGGLSAANLLDTIYSAGTVELMGLLLGFRRTPCPTNGEAESTGDVTCYSDRTFGATNRHVVSIIQCWVPDYQNVYPAVTLDMDTTAPPPLIRITSTTSTSSSSTTTTTTAKPKPTTTTTTPGPTTTTEPPMLNKAARAALLVIAIALVLFLVVLLWCLCTSPACCACMRRAPAADPMIPLDVPVTCVVFDYSTVVNDITGADGVREGGKAIDALENAISDAMDFYGVHEIERHGTVTAGVCANPWAALQCCLEVRESATMLGAASVAGLAAERGQKRMASAPPGVGVGRRGSTTSLPPIQVIDTAKVDLSCKRSEVLRGEGVPYATPAYDGAAGPGAEDGNAARGPQVREIRRRRASSVAVPHTLNVSLPRVSMGLATGMMVKKNVRGVQGPSWRGRPLLLARAIAAELSSEQVLVSGSTWFALSDSELRTVSCVGAHETFIHDAAFLTHRGIRNEEMLLYELEKAGAVERQHAAIDTTKVTLESTLTLFLSRMPPERRIPALLVMLRGWSIEPPPRPPGIADDVYITMLQRRLQADPTFNYGGTA